MKVFSILICILAFTLSAQAQKVTGYQQVGNSTIIMGGNSTTIMGPNGIITIQSGQDDIHGTWTGGIEVDIGRVLTNQFVPKKVIIDNFTMKMPDNESMDVLALTAEENNASAGTRRAALSARAQAICNMTGSHRYVHEVKTSSKWFSGLLLDVTNARIQDGKTTFTAYKASTFSGARYFDKIVCSLEPRGYTVGK